MLPGEMGFQFLAGHEYSFYDALLKISFFKMIFQNVFGVVPKIIGDCPVYALVAINDKFLVGYGNIDQYPVFFFGIVNL